MVKKSPLIVLISALFVFGGGFFLWLQAHDYRPTPPNQDPPRHFIYREQGAEFSSVRYQTLQNGQLFFGKPVITAPVIASAVVFQSHLILWGVSGGKDSRAVVGIDPKSNQQTEILKVGDEYAGETLVEIGRDYIVVRNQTGKGRIYMGME